VRGARRKPAPLRDLPPAGDLQIRGSETWFKTTLSATGSAIPYTWSATGLPDGVTVDPATGVISGRPTAAGTFPVHATVTGADGQTAGVDLSIKVARALELVTKRLRNAVAGDDYSTKLRAVGGVGDRIWRKVGGRLPAGVHLDSETGELTGTPRRAGKFSFKVRVRDSLGALSTKTLLLTVRA
jgi:Putative Ig domain